MTCEDCLYKKFCENTYGNTDYFDDEVITSDVENYCSRFEDKSLYFKLPCKVGDVVYINGWFGEAVPHKVRKINLPFIRTNSLNDESGTADFYSYEFGKAVFLTKEEAEKALERLENG